MANRTDLYIEGKFRNEADPKDGFLVRDCRNPRERKLLEFLVPIVHPDKPTRVTRMIGNTIFGALSGERPVHWSKVFSELVQWLVGGAGKSKSTPICPFLYHLYECKGLLTEEEETDYTTAKELNRYRISPERDQDSMWGPADHRTGTTKSASADQPGEEGKPVQEEPPNTGRVSTHPVKRRRESAELGGRTTNEPQANEPQTNQP